MHNLFKHLVAAAVVGVLAANVFAATINVTVYSNNPAPGDMFSAPATELAGVGQPVGASGWYYNRVTAGGAAGIRVDYPRSGNGSVWLQLDGTNVATPSYAKAHIEFYKRAAAYGPFGSPLYGPAKNQQGAIAPLNQLTAVSYDWYRKPYSGGWVATNVVPVLRIYFDTDGNLTDLSDSGWLLWDIRNDNYSYLAPNETWVTQTIGAGTKLVNSLTSFQIKTLAEWQQQLPNAVIVGFGVGLPEYSIGLNGKLDAAVDNISWTINGSTTTTNFEVVPEPTTMALFGLGLLGAAGGLLRRRSA